MCTGALTGDILIGKQSRVIVLSSLQQPPLHPDKLTPPFGPYTAVRARGPISKAGGHGAVTI